MAISSRRSKQALTLIVLGCLALAAWLDRQPAREASPNPPQSTESAGQTADSGLVASVHDGDTLQLRDGTRVRLASIDTPEMGKDGRRSWEYSLKAREELERLVRGKRISLESPDGAALHPDSFGRLVALVSVEGVGLVNEHLVRQGLAWLYPHEDTPPWLEGRLLEAQREAMERGRGLWPSLLAWKPMQGPMTGNVRSRRFFPASAPELKEISRRNLRDFKGLREAFWEGFAPARHAFNWP